MPDNVKIDVDPGKALSSFLKKAAEQVQDLRLPLNLIAQQWFKSNLAIFDLSGPGKYPPFKNSISAKSRGMALSGMRKGTHYDITKSPYQIQKLKEVGFDYPLLKKYGALESSITNPTDPNAVNYLINKVSMALGTTVPYAIYHQSKDPRTVMPYRPMILFGNEQVAPGALSGRVAQWKSLIENYVKRVSGVPNNGSV